MLGVEQIPSIAGGSSRRIRRNGSVTEHARTLMSEFFSGKIDRRQLMTRAAALGVSVSALGAVAAAPWKAIGVAAQDASPAAAPVGDLVVAAGGDIDTLDPHISQLLLYGDMVRRTVFNSLVTYADDLSYVGELAESWENPDESTYVFTLRDGLTYHDGTPVTAADVEFSFKRVVEQQTVLSSRLTNVDTYQVVDDKTISIKLKEIQADFLDGLTLINVISEAIAADVANTPIGTGPFKFVEWVPNDHIALEANTDYFIPGEPGVATLRFNILPEAQVQITNLKSGDVQGVLDVPVSQVTALEGDESVTILNVPTSSIHIFEMLGKNNETIRNNAKVRQALAMCIDKNAVQQTVFAGAGFPKWTFVGSTSWAYEAVPGYDYDPAGAKVILEEEGASGLEFTVLCIQGYPDGERASTIWQAGLGEAGVKLNIEVQELSVWLDNYINHTYDVIWNVFPGFADPNYFVALGLQPHFADGWTNEEAKTLATTANQTLDQDERKAQYGKLQELFVQDLPIMVIQEAPKVSLTAPDVANWGINSLSWVLLNNVTIGA
jgi:peptide/nickel transport system substrate-binding protein